MKLVLLALSVWLAGCGKGQSPQPAAPVTTVPAVDSQGAPVALTAESFGDADENVTPIAPLAGSVAEPALFDAAAPAAIPGTDLPAFDAAWGLSRAAYDKAAGYRAAHPDAFPNRRFVVIVDMSQHASRRRLYLFDLEAGTLERHVGSHGKNSDPSGTGWARYFSDRNGSQQSSLGVYKTLGTFYFARHGLSLRLAGLENTNAHALQRGILVHPARYMSDATGMAGRSWGCVAIDPRGSDALVRKIAGGAMLVIWK